VIRALINGRGPFAFVLDTAASGSTIDPSRAHKLGLPRDSGTDKAVGLGGEVEVSFHRIASIRAGPITLKNASLPSVPAPKFESHDVAGLTDVDLLAGKLTLWSPDKGCVHIARSGSKLGPGDWRPVKWIQAWKIMLPLRIGEVDGWALLDTGAQYTTINPAFAERLGLDANHLRSSGSIAGIDGRELNLFEAKVGPITIGPWRWDHRRLKIGALPVFDRLQPAGELLAILGMDWLASERFAVDYGRQSVWLCSGITTDGSRSHLSLPARLRC
jgi:predicted aspartyl protease